MRYFVLLCLILIACEKDRSDPLKVKSAKIIKLDTKEMNHDHQLVVCFEQDLNPNYFGFAKNNRFKHKLEIQISSRKGWTQRITKGVQKFQIIGGKPNCMDIINENYYHPFMSKDDVVEENFSTENITYIKVDIQKFNEEHDSYHKIDEFLWKADY